MIYNYLVINKIKSIIYNKRKKKLKKLLYYLSRFIFLTNILKIDFLVHY